MQRHILSKIRRTAGRQIARDSNRHVLTSHAHLKHFIDGAATSEFRTAAAVALRDLIVSYDVALRYDAGCSFADIRLENFVL
jgi:hypothetical protein